MNKNLRLMLSGLLLLLAGCTLAPKYARPNAPVPATWPSGAAYTNVPAGAQAPHAAELPWQEYFTDPQLQRIVVLALTNNRDLRIAVLNVERARAYYGIQRAELLPAVDAIGSGSRTRTPADLSSTGASQINERYDAGLGVAAWEIDFFGRIRSLKDRALQEYFATEQAHRSAQILLVSSVAQAYLTLAADRESLMLARTTYATQQAAYDLIRRRFELGLVPELDTLRAQAQVDSASSDVARYTQMVALDENALNLLAGSPVPSELLPAGLADVIPPAELCPGLPSEVLLQRPDVLQSESLLKAANADLGAARAAFFPRISLTAAFGTASSELDGLFASGSSAWSYAPRIVMPVFDGRTWSAHKAARVQREMAVTQYERAIQTAFREVADALAVRGTVDDQLAAQESLVRSVGGTHRLASSLYDKGLNDYLSVLDAQRSLYAAQQGLVYVRLLKFANQAQLFAVLGGGQPAAATGRPGTAVTSSCSPAEPATR